MVSASQVVMKVKGDDLCTWPRVNPQEVITIITLSDKGDGVKIQTRTASLRGPSFLDCANFAPLLLKVPRVQ